MINVTVNNHAPDLIDVSVRTDAEAGETVVEITRKKSLPPMTPREIDLAIGRSFGRGRQDKALPKADAAR